MQRGTAALAATAASTAALVAPTAALAAVTGSANQRCYSHVPTKGSQPIVVTLHGGTPGAGFQVVASVPGKGRGSAGSATGTYDAAGNGQAAITDVFPPSGTINPTKGQAVQLSVESFLPGAPAPITTPLGNVLITNLTVNVATKPIRVTRPRWVSVSGTPFAHKRLYGFVVKGKSRHVLKRVKLGKGNICGYTRRKVSLAPRHYRFGRYRLYINAGRKLNRNKAVFYNFRIFRL